MQCGTKELEHSLKCACFLSSIQCLILKLSKMVIKYKSLSLYYLEYNHLGLLSKLISTIQGVPWLEKSTNLCLSEPKS